MKGGRNPIPRAMMELWYFINSNILKECVGYRIKFSWCNNQIGQRRILAKMDKALCNLDWKGKHDGWSYKTLARTKSDHGPLIGRLRKL